MAKNQTIRLRPRYLQADLDAFMALKALPNYTANNPNYTTATGDSVLTALKDAQKAELLAQNALASARDNNVAAEWDFHNFILQAKSQVIALYGADSNEIQSLGLKKKSERKTRVRKPPTAAA